MLQLAPDQILPESLCGGVVAIGNFDGMHRGHQQLLATAKAAAERLGKSFGLLTFEPHPRSFFQPPEPVFRLTPPPLKALLAKILGAGFVATVNFDAVTASQSPEEFITQQLVKRLGVAHVITGFDFHFGKGRKGTSETLVAAGKSLGFGVTVVEQVADEGEGTMAPFSSSAIRSSLRRGHVREAAKGLGYQWVVMGEVVPGDQRGRTIGFPTANIILEPGAEPYRGIYAVTVREKKGGPLWQGAAYFGDRPTFNTNRTFLEVYLLDQDIDLYGKTLVVNFVDLVRGDKTFSSVADLVDQMKEDCGAVRKILLADKPMDFPLAKAQAQGLIAV
ncbi:MAG: bifunctional riboflavin kinase/FAD synthetase [Aestuariivirga sp.]